MGKVKKWSLPVAKIDFARAFYKNEKLADAAYRTVVNECSLTELFGKMLKTLPIDATLRTYGDNEALGVFVDGHMLAFAYENKNVLSMLPPAVRLIEGEVLDGWPDFVNRLLASFTVNTGQPLSLCSDPKDFETNRPWRVVYCGDVTYLTARDTKDRDYVVCIAVTKAAEIPEDNNLSTVPFIV